MIQSVGQDSPCTLELTRLSDVTNSYTVIRCVYVSDIMPRIWQGKPSGKLVYRPTVALPNMDINQKTETWIATAHLNSERERKTYFVF